MAIVKKVIKFDLPIDNTKVKSIEELSDHVTIELLEYLKNGLLNKWLVSREEQELVNKFNEIDLTLEDRIIFSKILDILGFDSNPQIVETYFTNTSNNQSRLDNVINPNHSIIINDNTCHTIQDLISQLNSEIIYQKLENNELVIKLVSGELHDWISNIDVNLADKISRYQSMTNQLEIILDFYQVLNATNVINKMSFSGCNLDNIPDLISKFNNITYLSFSGLGLVTIPEWVFNNKHLSKINLSGNDELGNEQISKLKKLTNLKHLEVKSMAWKNLPNEICELDSLEMLDLSWNKLTSLPNCISNLKNLKILICEYNNWGAYYKASEAFKLPSNFCELINLRELNLINTRLSELPYSIGNLENLEKLHISGNCINSFPSSICNLKKLKELHANDQSRTEEIDWSKIDFSNYTEPQELSLELPYSFGDLESLEVLNLSSCNLRNFPSTCVKLARLKNLDIQYSYLQSFPTEIYSLKNLESLKFTTRKSISNECVDESLGNLKKLKQLRIDDMILPRTIIELKELEELSIENYAPECIFELSWLSKLTISGREINQLSNKISNLRNLTDLKIWYTKISSIPEDIGKLTNLLNLDLYNNELSSLPESIGSLKNLASCDLHTNKLRKLPNSLSNLIKLKTLLLNDNKLIELPDGIGLLVELERLNCDDNNLIELPSAAFKIKNVSFKNNENIIPNMDYSGQDLSNHDFSGKLLIGANFSNCIINNTNFDGADLQRAIFSNVSIRKSSFVKANISNGNFTSSHITNCNFEETELQNTVIESTKIINSELNRANFKEAIFSNSLMENCTSEFGKFDMDLIKSQLIENTFIHCIFIDFKVNNIELSDINEIDPSVKIEQNDFKSSVFSSQVSEVFAEFITNYSNKNKNIDKKEYKSMFATAIIPSGILGSLFGPSESIRPKPLFTLDCAS